jgi:hypothetical protein
MRITLAGFRVALLIVSAASGQTVDRVFHYAHTETVQNMQEIATAIRTVGDIKDVSVDMDQRTFTVRGTTAQVAFADWLFTGLDQPVASQPDTATHEYRLSEASDNIVRLYNIDHGQSVQDFQEFATALRTVLEIRRLFTYNAPRVIVARGSADQMAIADLLVAELGKRTSGAGSHTISVEYRLLASPSPSPNENVLRVFYVANSPTVQDFQGFATMIRTITEIRRVFTYSAQGAMVVRGTSDQLTFAQWLFNEIDKPANARQSPESALYRYQVPGDSDDSVRVFYLLHTSDPDFQKIATQVRTRAGIRRAYALSGARALVLRGTGEQVALGERMIKNLDPADFPSAE